MTTASDPCPCGSEKPIAQCCQLLLGGKAKAKTAEELLRARYTAFTVGDVDFILNTHHPKTAHEIKRAEIEEWSKNSEWLGFRVLEKEAGEAADEKGTIIFHAQYKADGKVTDHYEKSYFEKDGGEWRFLDAQGLRHGPIRREGPKIGRNDPCPCGSGKKFKKCCEGQAAESNPA